MPLMPTEALLDVNVVIAAYFADCTLQRYSEMDSHDKYSGFNP